MANVSSSTEWYPGQVWPQDKTDEDLADRSFIKLTVQNTGDRPVQVGSHFHFFETNRGLRFDRASAYGMRLAIPAGTAVRFEPGQNHEVELVSLAGERYCQGLNNLVNGLLDEPGKKEQALEQAKRDGFL